MNAEEYLKNRVQDQIDWYDRKSSSNRKMFKSLRLSEIILSALIPFLSGITAILASYEKEGIIIISLFGVIIACMAGILSLGQFQEHWIEYRTTAEGLKKEKYLFQTMVEPYNKEDSFSIFVQKIETLVSKENTNWSQYMMKRKEGDKKND
ncbi:MAG: hypothetical protein A2315_04965 [Ignavibacteria bacterium RIFOXYB2_FULL_35_12]|nr:MAG: hypothetical protein A2058_12520 [Ignavibacteria bacterium GWA2_36_19]OGU53417.1 MAG: hypothetical protein A2006_10600 [Ignavibacteria bacterium GWC2_35_8]OGU60789.1 MAG: hypothetical protein A2X60_09640 [Ignavibacteria bacterium GWF2_35_20]OGU83096.1 MAG: hypothetical protein A2254_08610 [Ignavibacteria bacterium RIFOXYA2_FULL_35_9]OGU84171.1 MAG: hypothetical protein A3K31_03210 [Ignavibacteria bacterium RIFOXYA12_FULL_35_25]OGU97321.1 MAG: hypothetical protein A2347_06625 [Ignavibac